MVISGWSDLRVNSINLDGLDNINKLEELIEQEEEFNELDTDVTEDEVEDPETKKEDLSYKESELNSIQIYMNSIGKRPLLTAIEEVDLAKKIKEGDARSKKLSYYIKSKTCSKYC